MALEMGRTDFQKMWLILTHFFLNVKRFFQNCKRTGDLVVQKQEEQEETTLWKTYESPNAVVRVYRPTLTEEERAERMKTLHDDMARMLISVWQSK